MCRLSTSVARIFAIALVLGGFQFMVAQTLLDNGSDTKACKLMPTPDLEQAFGGKATNPHGTDGTTSICTVNIGTVAVKLQSAPQDATGAPSSISQGLAGARMMLGVAKQARKSSTKDFGKVGCLSMKMTRGFDNKRLTRPLITTSCFLLEGGYLNISVSSENPRQAGFELIKLLLEKAAARR